MILGSPSTTPLTPPKGLGDSYYPSLGNAGYDARHYDLFLKVDPATNQVDARTVVTAKATEKLDSLNLDFVGCQVSKVEVNGESARFDRHENKLHVEPQSPLAAGQDFQVKVDYHGSPQAFKSEAGDFTVGWKNHEGQFITVDSQPDGAQSWFPNNNHPLDKATYSIAVDVPKPFVAAANGTLVQLEDTPDHRVYHFESKDPMASYLATVNIGNYVTETSVGPGGLPIRNYFPPELADKARFDFGRTPEIIDFLSQRFGPYPFENYGVVVVPAEKVIDQPLETQTLSQFNPALVTGDRKNEDLVVHELAHQWFGNKVSLGRWQDIVLNESFAQYSEWLWLEHTQGKEALQKAVGDTYESLKGLPDISIAAPPKDHLFTDQVYERGAVALHELRAKVGDEAFFGALPGYVANHQNATLDDLQHALEATSGQPLADFFRTWFHDPALPPLSPAPP